MKSIVCALFVLVNLLAFGQTRSATAQLTDISEPKQQIIAFDGSMTFNERQTNGNWSQTPTGTATGTVVSAKGIVTLVAGFQWSALGGPAQALSARHEHFFKSHNLMPGEIVEFPVAGDMTLTNESSVSEVRPPARYTVKLAFVQFEDGATWGDPRIGNELAAQRADIVAYLAILRSAFANNGEQGLAAALKGNPVADEHQRFTTAFGMKQKLLMIQAQSGSTAVLDEINADLKIAADRKATGKF